MRDYDATLGRYIQADPLGLVDGASVYGYVRSNPATLSDPTGQCPWCAAAVVAAVAALMPDPANAPGPNDEIACADPSAPYLAAIDAVNPFGKAAKVVGLAAKAGKAYGGGKNAQKNRNRDKIDEELADAQKRLKESKEKPNKTPEDKAERKRIEAEIARLQKQRRESENHSMKPKR